MQMYWMGILDFVANNDSDFYLSPDSWSSIYIKPTNQNPLFI
jgi:hypothetical protein